MSISRREFLGTAALAGLAAGPLAADDGKTTLPTRVLGKTGESVSILGFGGGSRYYLAYKQEDQAFAAITRALDLGITYIDTADDYGGHLSEQRIGKAIKGRRKGLFLVSKVTPRSGDELGFEHLALLLGVEGKELGLFLRWARAAAAPVAAAAEDETALSPHIS